MHLNLEWDSVCLVGLGSHAKNKLLPGLEAAGLELIAIVTRNPVIAVSGVQIFLTVTDAVSNLPETTLFVIATPSNVHYAQAKELIEADRDVFVEKPAFLSFKESVELSRLATERGLVLVEMLMYLENNSVQRIIDELIFAPGSVKNIECQFLIPSVPLGTFRTETSIGNSLLSDMACYPLSMLAIAGYELRNLMLVPNSIVDGNNRIFRIEGNSRQTKIDIQVGCNGEYLNKVKVEFDYDREISCEPFFYGREGDRAVIEVSKAGKLVEPMCEHNAYELMFLRKRPEWVATQQSRLNSLGLVSQSIERLGRQAGLL